ncbi:hypothetical protein GCM10010299_64630 [Streptomyces tanashiensis]|nr:hypothetical protein GCM10010299_64630 [Streptomyces tanashiensis]
MVEFAGRGARVDGDADTGGADDGEVTLHGGDGVAEEERDAVAAPEAEVRQMAGQPGRPRLQFPVADRAPPVDESGFVAESFGVLQKEFRKGLDDFALHHDVTPSGITRIVREKPQDWTFRPG